MNNSNYRSTRDGFSDAIYHLGKKNKNVFVLTADFRESLGVDGFAESFPDQFVECGIAEQNMMGIAAGLASNKIIPFTTSVSVFQPGRSWDQLRVSVCLSNLPVKVISSHAGFSNYKDGANQQSFEDIAITRVLPNLKVIVPADYIQAVKATYCLYKDISPNYLRLSKESNPAVTNESDAFEIGKAQILKQGNDLTIISAGPMIYHVLQAIERIHISVELINLHTIKPIDEKAIIESAKKTKKVITIEDHQIQGGLGSAVSEVLSQNYPVKMKMLGLNNTFAKSARNINDLYKKYSLDSDSIAERIKNFVG